MVVAMLTVQCRRRGLGVAAAVSFMHEQVERHEA